MSHPLPTFRPARRLAAWSALAVAALAASGCLNSALRTTATAASAATAAAGTFATALAETTGTALDYAGSVPTRAALLHTRYDDARDFAEGEGAHFARRTARNLGDTLTALAFDGELEIGRAAAETRHSFLDLFAAFKEQVRRVLGDGDAFFRRELSRREVMALYREAYRLERAYWLTREPFRPVDAEDFLARGHVGIDNLPGLTDPGKKRPERDRLAGTVPYNAEPDSPLAYLNDKLQYTPYGHDFDLAMHGFTAREAKEMESGPPEPVDAKEFLEGYDPDAALTREEWDARALVMKEDGRLAARNLPRWNLARRLRGRLGGRSDNREADNPRGSSVAEIIAGATERLPVEEARTPSLIETLRLLTR